MPIQRSFQGFEIIRFRVCRFSPTLFKNFFLCYLLHPVNFLHTRSPVPTSKASIFSTLVLYMMLIIVFSSRKTVVCLSFKFSPEIYLNHTRGIHYNVYVYINDCEMNGYGGNRNFFFHINDRSTIGSVERIYHCFN